MRILLFVYDNEIRQTYTNTSKNNMQRESQKKNHSICVYAKIFDFTYEYDINI